MSTTTNDGVERHAHISIKEIPAQLREFAEKEVILRDGRRMTELEAALEEAREAASIAGAKLTRKVIVSVLEKNALSSEEETE